MQVGRLKVGRAWVESLAKFLNKNRGRDGISIFLGVWDLLRKRGDLFQGDCSFYIKSKEKSSFRL